VAEARLGANLSSPEEPFSRHRRVLFTLDDGSELEVRLDGEGTGITVRNVGKMEPQGVIASPVSGNVLWVGVH